MTLWQWAVCGLVFGHVRIAIGLIVRADRDMVPRSAKVAWRLFDVAAFAFYGWLWSKGVR